MDKKQLKLGVWEGDGPSPGYLWTVGILDCAFEEAMGFLSEAQYSHMAMQFKELALEADPSHSLTADITKIEDFFELKDKGGILGKINVRIFFGIHHEQRAMIVLGSINKGNEGQTPQGTKITMRRRWRKYQIGDYGAIQ